MKPRPAKRRPQRGHLKVTPLLDLRACRIDAGVSLEFLAQDTGIGRATLARIEAGATPSLANAMRLAPFYDTIIEELWGIEG